MTNNISLVFKIIDYLFTCGNRQESVAKVVVSNPLPFDHSPLLCSFINTLNQSLSFDMYKFGNALIDGADFVKHNKAHVNTV